MTVKEKAKRYDEALEIARQYWNDRAMPIGTNFKLERMFPELKESEEDEGIRKYILSHFQEHLNKTKEFLSKGMVAPFSSEEIKMLEASVSWLEKQGEKPNNAYDKELSEILGRVIRRYINDPDIPYSDREKVSMEIIPYVERLEKQGEQKSIVVIPKF